MIISIIIGRGDSSLHRKNLRNINRKPLLSYPITASRDSMFVDEVYFCTEDEEMKQVARYYGASIIDRPRELSSDFALREDVFKWAYDQIKHNYAPFTLDFTDYQMGELGPQRSNKESIEFVLLLFANAVGLHGKMIDEMIQRLRYLPSADSIISMSEYPAFSPYRMRKLVNDGNYVDWVEPFVDNIDWSNIDCDRSSGEKAYIYDCCCAVVRPRCLDNLQQGQPPQKWLGNKILPYTKYRDIPCLDIDEEFHFPQMQMWLDKYWE